jgi:hypothetical protein
MAGGKEQDISCEIFVTYQKKILNPMFNQIVILSIGFF